MGLRLTWVQKSTTGWPTGIALLLSSSLNGGGGEDRND